MTYACCAHMRGATARTVAIAWCTLLGSCAFAQGNASFRTQRGELRSEGHSSRDDRRQSCRCGTYGYRDCSGHIAEIKLRCDKQYVFFPFDPEVNRLANTAGACHLEVVGEAGSTFDLIQS